MSRDVGSVAIKEQPRQEGRGSGESRAKKRSEGARQGRPDGRASSSRREARETAPSPVSKVPRLLSWYRDEIVPTLMKEFGYGVSLQVPRLEKVVINVGLGEALQNANALEATTQMLATISGQQAVVTKARRSIAGFKLRAGMRIGAMVTLRSRRMYDLVDRLLNATLPRIRDFRGVSRSSFDGRGNYSLGIREQVIFPEIDYGSVDRIRGLQISIVTTARTDGEALRLLELLGMPFAREERRG